MKRIKSLAGLAIGVFGIIAVAWAQNDPKERKNTILMVAKSANATTAARCSAIVPYDPQPTKRKQRVRWTIKNDDNFKCENMDPLRVSVHLADDAMDSKILTATDPVFGAPRIIGRTRDDTPDGRYKYVVYFEDMQAGPDPELDVDGECKGCGPGGGR